MKAIIRNCAHGGTSVISVVYDKKGSPAWVAKSSENKAGIKDILQEHEGFQWYANHVSYAPQAEISRQTENYILLQSDYVFGKSGKHNYGLLRNSSLIISAIMHYIAVWGSWSKNAQNLESAPMHGDLSVDNIILNDKGTIFIDWEHFHVSALPIGFDICYLLLESLWYESRTRHGHISNEAIYFIQHCIRLLSKEGCLSKRFMAKPFRSTLDTFIERSELWGNQIYKFPVLKSPIDCIDIIDQRIRESLCLSSGDLIQ